MIKAPIPIAAFSFFNKDAIYLIIIPSPPSPSCFSTSLRKITYSYSELQKRIKKYGFIDKA